MAETLQPDSRSSTLQVVSPDNAVPIQLIWIRSRATEIIIDLATDVVANTRGRYTELFDVPPSWGMVSRNEAWRLLNPNVFTR